MLFFLSFPSLSLYEYVCRGQTVHMYTHLTWYLCTCVPVCKKNVSLKLDSQNPPIS